MFPSVQGQNMLRDVGAIQHVKVKQHCTSWAFLRCEQKGSLCVQAAKVFPETPELHCELWGAFVSLRFLRSS